MQIFSFFFFFNDTATTEIYTLSLHDALPISRSNLRCSTEASGASRSGIMSSASMICVAIPTTSARRSEEHTSELQSRLHLVCRLLLEKKKHKKSTHQRMQRRNRSELNRHGHY